MILLLGADGQFGQELRRAARARGVAVHGLNRAAADIADRCAVEAVLAATSPHLVVNAAAFTAVDQAETLREAALRANGAGPAVLAAATAARGLPLVHLSTDYVFDGSKKGAYVETDPACPLNVYGLSKRLGEQAVEALNPRAFILRTSWVYGVFGANFLKTALKLARTRDELRVVADQTGAPTSTATLASAVLAIAARLEDPRATTDNIFGLYHVVADGVATWHGFASAILEMAAPRIGRRPPIVAIQTQDYPTPARRPANSLLDKSKFERTFDWRAPDWRLETQKVLDELLDRI